MGTTEKQTVTICFDLKSWYHGKKIRVVIALKILHIYVGYNKISIQPSGDIFCDSKFMYSFSFSKVILQQKLLEKEFQTLLYLMMPFLIFP